MLEVDIAKAREDFALRLRFRVPRGGVCVVFGPSGSGKSTLINCIAGLETPDAGRIACDNKILFDAAAGVNLPPEARGLGYVFPDARLFPHLNVRENLCFGLRYHRNVDAGQRRHAPDLESVARLLDILPLLERAPATLSGGERQRVAVGRALLCRPRLLLMDEPLAALDMTLKRDLLAYLARIPEHWDLPVLYVTHAPGEALALGSAMLLLQAGRLAAQGPVAPTLAEARRLGLLPMDTFYPTGEFFHETSHVA